MCEWTEKGIDNGKTKITRKFQEETRLVIESDFHSEPPISGLEPN